MSQWRLPFRRFELPAYRVTWREGNVTRIIQIGERCHDEDWQRWKPWNAWSHTHGGIAISGTMISASR